jgi:hypothetical protein
MRKVWISILLALAAPFLQSQVIVGDYYTIAVVSTPPAGACLSSFGAQIVMSTGIIYNCQNGVWTQSVSSGAPVTIAAGPAVGAGSAICDTADGFTCNDQRGTVTVVVSTGATGILFAVSWATAWPFPPVCGYSNSVGAFLIGGAVTYFTVTTTSATFNETAVPINGTYKVTYHCS